MVNMGLTDAEILKAANGALDLLATKNKHQMLAFQQDADGKVTPVLRSGNGLGDMFAHLPTQPRTAETLGPIILHLKALYG